MDIVQRVPLFVTLLAALQLPLVIPVAGARSTDPLPAQATIDRWLKSRALKGKRVGVAVRCTDDGSWWGGAAMDELFNPASGTKLLTTAAALHQMKDTAAWPTVVRGALSPQSQGRVAGDLQVVGMGDPQLMPEDLELLADRLVEAGVRSVSGDLVVRGGHFDADSSPPAYEQKNTDAAYRPNVSAVGTNYGAVRVTVTPGRRVGRDARVTIDPASDAVVVTGTVATVSAEFPDREPLQVRAIPLPDGRTRVDVAGTMVRGARRHRERKRVTDPDLLTGYVLAAALARRDVTIAGQVRADPAPPTVAPELARVGSATLSETLRDMNTWSNNYMAETLFKSLGTPADGGPAGWAAAQTAVSRHLRALSLSPAGFRVVNGSGLYRASRITPRAMTTLLGAFAGPGPRDRAFRASLAIGGETGTLRQRLRSARVKGKVRAKTGTLDEVGSISGYLDISRCKLAFSIIVNGGVASETQRLRRTMDRLILRLARL